MAANATLALSITGMTCGSCVRHVTEALRGLDGVAEAQVDLRAGRATVAYDPAVVPAAEMVRAVEEAGYGASLAPGDRAPAPPVQGGRGCSCCA